MPGGVTEGPTDRRYSCPRRSTPWEGLPFRGGRGAFSQGPPDPGSVRLARPERRIERPRARAGITNPTNQRYRLRLWFTLSLRVIGKPSLARQAERWFRLSKAGTGKAPGRFKRLAGKANGGVGSPTRARRARPNPPAPRGGRARAGPGPVASLSEPARRGRPPEPAPSMPWPTHQCRASRPMRVRHCYTIATMRYWRWPAPA